MWGWLREGRPPEALAAAGWAGAISLPRVLTLDPAGRLRSEPAPELQVLRGRRFTRTDIPLSAAAPHNVDGVVGDRLEIVAEFEPAHADTVGLAVRCSPDGAEQTRITYSFMKDHLELDCRQSSLDPTTERPLTGGRCACPVAVRCASKYSSMGRPSRSLPTVAPRPAGSTRRGPTASASSCSAPAAMPAWFH